MSKNQQNNETCSSCRRPKPADCITKTCDECKARSAKNKLAAKKKKVECQAIKPATGIKCNSKVNAKCGNMYCLKHIKHWNELQETGGQAVRRCNSRTQCDPDKPGKVILPPDYPNKKCISCLKKDNLKSKNTRDKKNKSNNKLIKTNANIRICSECPISVTHTIEEMGVCKNGDRSKLCKKHFEAQQEIDRNRIKKDRTEEMRAYEKTPKRIAAKKKLRKEHPEREYRYYTSYRARKLNENPVEYRKKLADNAAKWRLKHPENAKKLSKRRKTDPKCDYSVYAWRANRDGYDFELPYEKFEKMVNEKCYYCSMEKKTILLGIDRLDNSLGYVEGNIVTCCKTCNMMKNTLNEATFILMCAHIAHYNTTFKSKLYPKVFNNYDGSTYDHYKHRAIVQKKINFDISKKEFDILRYGDACYNCGKYSTDDHCNGIDRYDNSKGYEEGNCKSCCGDCNYMKKDLNHTDFILKCGYIASEHRARLKELEKNWTPSKFTEFNKSKKRLTSEEKIIFKKENDAKRHKKQWKVKLPKRSREKLLKSKLKK